MSAHKQTEQCLSGRRVLDSSPMCSVHLVWVYNLSAQGIIIQHTGIFQGKYFHVFFFPDEKKKNVPLAKIPLENEPQVKKDYFSFLPPVTILLGLLC